MVSHTYQMDKNGRLYLSASDLSPEDADWIKAINGINDCLKAAAKKTREQIRRRDFFYGDVAPVIIDSCKGLITSDESSEATKKFAQGMIWDINGVPSD